LGYKANQNKTKERNTKAKRLLPTPSGENPNNIALEAQEGLPEEKCE